MSLSRRARLPVLVTAMALWVTPATADVTDIETCRMTMRPTHRDIAVRDSWPLVERHLLAKPDQIAKGLRITLLIPVQQGANDTQTQSCLASYLVEDLRRLPDDRILGNIVPTSMDAPAFFFDEVAVSPDRIVDWIYTAPDEALQYGHYNARRHIPNASDDTLIDNHLNPVPIPPAWH